MSWLEEGILGFFFEATMQIFAIFEVEDPSAIEERAKEHYLNNFHKTEAGFFIATTGETTREVAAKLGIGESEEPPMAGVVLAVSSYWGCYFSDLWEWLDVKTSTNGK